MAVAMDNAILENILRQVRRDFPGAQYPERIIQFGEGNFLRAFVDWQIDLLNEHTDLPSVLKTMIYRWMPSATLLKLTCYR